MGGGAWQDTDASLGGGATVGSLHEGAQLTLSLPWVVGAPPGSTLGGHPKKRLQCSLNSEPKPHRCRYASQCLWIDPGALSNAVRKKVLSRSPP